MVGASMLSSSEGFARSPNHPSFVTSLQQSVATVAETASNTLEVQKAKPTGTSFLPEETIERATAGSPIEKIKLAKDGTAAFVDVYEYARKIREGEMTWEEVEKADLDTVSEQWTRLPTCSLDLSFQDRFSYTHPCSICFHSLSLLINSA